MIGKQIIVTSKKHPLRGEKGTIISQDDVTKKYNVEMKKDPHYDFHIGRSEFRVIKNDKFVDVNGD